MAFVTITDTDGAEQSWGNGAALFDMYPCVSCAAVACHKGGPNKLPQGQPQ